MPLCQYHETTLTCPTCGDIAARLPKFRRCKPVPTKREPPSPDCLPLAEAQRRARGLGDITADSLASVGITKERVAYWLGRVCGCDARQEWLNEVGKLFGIGT